jgi:SAM-dependent methyltransferase
MNEPQLPTKVDFDEYSEEYEALLQSQLGFFSEDRGYFSSYKIATLRRIFPEGFDKILDFGSGVGLTLPYVAKFFPESEITATDISKASLRHIARNFPNVSVIDDDLVDAHKFDLILVITVMHHVAPPQRAALMKRLSGLLTENGKLCIFEHNPYNPVTQRMVSTCAFDKDAILLSRAETKRLFNENTDLSVTHSGYTLFFPGSLSALRPMERFMTQVPLGGQYYVVGEKV